MPLADLGADTTTKLTGFLIQQNSADAAPTFYVDDIALTAAKGAKTPPAPKAAEVPFLRHSGIKPLPFTGVSLSGRRV